MKTILALETSCDETAVAILRGRNSHSGSELLASEVASQIAEHEKHGGIVPEVAARNHLVHAPRLLERTTLDAKIDMSMVDVFAATSGPGLASSLMIGASIAKAILKRWLNNSALLSDTAASAVDILFAGRGFLIHSGPQRIAPDTRNEGGRDTDLGQMRGHVERRTARMFTRR